MFVLFTLTYSTGGISVWVLSVVVLISMFVLLFDGHAIRKQNEEIKLQNKKILDELESLKNK